MGVRTGERDHLAGLVFLGAALVLALSIAAWCTHDWVSAAPGPEAPGMALASTAGAAPAMATADRRDAGLEMRVVWTGMSDATAVHTR